MSIFLPTDKHFKIQQLALCLKPMQPVTICQVISFFSKASFYAKIQEQLCHLCYVSQCNILCIHHCMVHLFCSFHFFLCSTLASMIVSVAKVSTSLTFFSSQCGFHYICYSQSLDLLPQGSGSPLSFSGTWSVSMWYTHIIVQEL